jgi:predicted MFS family arabinose efflux permease
MKKKSFLRGRHGALSDRWRSASACWSRRRAPNDQPCRKAFGLLKRRHVAFGMAAVMLTYAGAFAGFTYLRPFLESYTHVSLPQLSLLLLGLGLAGFAGTYGASALVGRHLFSLLCGLPMALAAVTIGLLALGHSLWGVAAMMVVWGTLNSAIPVAWSTWLSKGIRDEPESGGGLMVGTIQLAIMLRGFRGTVARPSFDCGNVHWKRCFAGDRFSCRRRR